MNFICVSGCAQTFTAKRLRYLIFLTVFWTFLDNYSAKLDIIGLFDTICCWKLCNLLRPVSFEKKYDLQTSKTFRISTVFWHFFSTFFDNCGANSRVKCSIEKPDFVNLPYSTDHDLLLAEKKIRASESHVFEL